MDIPDDLYRRVKAKSALQGRAIREVTMELYQRWLADEAEPEREQSAGQWLSGWLRLGQETLRDATAGPTASEIVEADRQRLEGE